jgi:hypothetical protein
LFSPNKKKLLQVQDTSKKIGGVGNKVQKLFPLLATMFVGDKVHKIVPLIGNNVRWEQS